MSSELTTIAQSNTINVYDRIADPVVYCTQMAKAAASMMGAPVDQGEAIAMHALCEGMTLVEMRRRYHWIQGAPTMRSDAMAAEFKLNYGGKITAIEKEFDHAKATFTTADGEETVCTLTWEDLKQSRFPWKNWKADPKELKDNYATPYDQRNMLWSRLVSDTLRTICPELVAGVYTPEEMSDVQPAVLLEAKKGPTVDELLSKSQPAADLDTDPDAGVEVAEVTTKPTDPKEPGSIVQRHIDRIRELFETAGSTKEKIDAILHDKYGASTVRNLSDEQGVDLVQRLEAKLRKMDAAAGK